MSVDADVLAGALRAVDRSYFPEELEEAFAGLEYVEGHAELAAALRRRYGQLRAKPEPDKSGRLRGLVLMELGRQGVAGDAELLRSALEAVHPPHCRAGAVVGLGRLDLELGSYAAVSLLFAEAHPTSGEPQVSAVRVLGAAGQLPLVAHVAASAASHPAAGGEAMRWLSDAPAAARVEAIAAAFERAEPMLHAGLADLLIELEDEERLLALLGRADEEVFEYAAFSLAGKRRLALLQRLQAAALGERRREALAGALALF